MTYFDASQLWENLNETMLNDERFRGFRPAIIKAGSEYEVKIREIYK